MHFATFVAALVAAWHYFCAHIAPFLAATVIPTVIAGLASKQSNSRAVAVLKAVARFCGWATHADELGSVKMPAGELLVLVGKGAVELYKALKGPGAGGAAALLIGFMLCVNGCATVSTPANATIAQKFQADAQALQKVANDVKAQCGDKFAPFAPLFASLLAVAADPYNVTADILAAVAAIPAIAQDIKGAQCVVKVIRDDFNALKPAAATPAAKAAAMADRVLAILDNALEYPAARAQLLALTSTPPVCDPTNDADVRTCREISLDDNVPPVDMGSK